MIANFGGIGLRFKSTSLFSPLVGEGLGVICGAALQRGGGR